MASCIVKFLFQKQEPKFNDSSNDRSMLALSFVTPRSGARRWPVAGNKGASQLMFLLRFVIMISDVKHHIWWKDFSFDNQNHHDAKEMSDESIIAGSRAFRRKTRRKIPGAGRKAQVTLDGPMTERGPEK